MGQFVRNPGVEAAPMNEETVLYDPAGNQFMVLNPTAACMWDRLQEPQSVQDLSAAVCEEFDGAVKSDVERDVQAALDRFLELQVVVPVDSM